MGIPRSAAIDDQLPGRALAAGIERDDGGNQVQVVLLCFVRQGLLPAEQYIMEVRS